MPLLPSGRMLGLATTLAYEELVQAVQGDPVSRAALEQVEAPEELFPFFAVVERTSDGRDERVGVSVRQFLDGVDGFAESDRAAYAEWLQQPHVRERLQQDLDELREALKRIPFELTGEAAEVFPGEHSAEVLLAFAKKLMARGERSSKSDNLGCDEAIARVRLRDGS